MTFEKSIISELSIPEPNTGCWIWISLLDRKGYGRVWFNGKEQRAHRLSAHLYLDMKLDDEVQALHKCDNTWCVNPEHLFTGSNLDNIKDRISKGRGRRKRFCRRGHEYTVENSEIRFKGNTMYRKCRQCKNLLRRKK